MPQREDRVEHRADAVRQRPVVGQRRRRPDVPVAADEAHPVGLVLDGPDPLALDHREVGHPHARLVRRPRPPRRDQRVERVEMAGLHEHLGEGGVRVVGRRGRQHDLGVRRQLDLARASTAVGERHAPHLGGVLARDHDLHRRRQRAVAPREGRVVLGEDDLGVDVLRAERLRRRRPRLPALHVAQEDERPFGVAGRVLAPARDGDVAPAAVAGPRRRDHHRVMAVRQQVRDGRAAGRRIEAPGHHGIAASPVAVVRKSSTRSSRSLTSRGMRSCSSSSLATIIGSAWKRARIAPSCSVLAMATIVMPW